MLSNKFLFALPLVAAQAAASSLATTGEKQLTDADIAKAKLDVLRVFYPDCEGLKNLVIEYAGQLI